jgi:hypothetical protein
MTEQAESEEEVFEGLTGAVPNRTVKLNSFYKQPTPKTTEKYYKEDKLQNELVRQWKVIIEDIELTNHSASTMSPFIRFTIGGNYYVSSRLPYRRLKSKSLQMASQPTYLKANKVRYR